MQKRRYGSIILSLLVFCVLMIPLKAEAAISVGDNNAEYSSFAEAVAAVPDGGTIDLGGSTYEVSGDISANKSFTITNGKLDLTADRINITGGAKVTFGDDLTVKSNRNWVGEYRELSIDNGSGLTINSRFVGTTINVLENVSIVIPAGSNGTLLIKNARIKSAGDNAVEAYGGQVTITRDTNLDSVQIAGTIKLGGSCRGSISTGYFENAVQTEGSAQLTITDGTFTRLVNAQGNSTVNINAGSFRDSIDANGGTVNVYGGDIGTASTSRVGVVYAYNNGTLNITGGTFGYELQVSSNGKTNISGGTFGQKISAYSGDVTIDDGTFNGTFYKGESGNIVINGGNFKNDPSAYLPIGRKTEITEDGRYVVVEGISSIDNANVVLNETSFVFNGKTQTPAIKTIGGKSLISGTDYTVKYSQGGTAVSSPVNAGTYTLTVTGRGDYTGTTSATFTIEKALLTIKADNKSKTYGQNDPELTYTADGLLKEDANKLNCRLTRTAGEDIGSYSIIPSGTLTAPTNNYTVVFNGGIFTIRKAAITITAKDMVGPDDPDVSSFGYVISGDIKEADKAGLNVRLSLGTPSGTDPKTYPINVSYTSNSNYDISTVDGKYTVADKSDGSGGSGGSGGSDTPSDTDPSSSPITISVYGFSGEYDGYMHGIEVETEVDSSAYEILFADKEFDSWAEAKAYSTGSGYGFEDAGTHTLYYYMMVGDTFIRGSKDVVITPRQVTIRANDISKAYGKNDPELTYTVDNLLDQDEGRLSCDLVRAEGESVGSYAIYMSGELQQLGSNYDVSFHSGTFKINPPAKAVKKLKKGKKSFTASWKKATKAEKAVIDGYQIRYSLKKNFKAAKKKPVKTKNIKKSAAKAAIKGLKAKKTYYVQIRTYKNVNGTRYYSAWSKTRKIRTK